MIERLEWVAGPHALTWREPVLRAGVLVNEGKRRRLLVGQLRDRELGHVLTWVMDAPRSAFQTAVRMERLWLDVPRARNWTLGLNKAYAPQIPHGFTIAKAGAPFERGLII